MQIILLWKLKCVLITSVECFYSSNTTIYIYSIYIKYFLHKVQLHVSALDNGHLQAVHEILIKKLYKTYMACLCGVREGVKWARESV